MVFNLKFHSSSQTVRLTFYSAFMMGCVDQCPVLPCSPCKMCECVRKCFRNAILILLFIFAKYVIGFVVELQHAWMLHCLDKFI